MKKVLIVDDEAIVRVTLRSLVKWETFGMEIAADFSNGYAALEYMRKNPVDLLLTDVKMPEMSGIELLRKLNEEGRAPLTLMLSGYNEFDLVREAFRLGVCDYLLKADLDEENLGRFLGELVQKYWGIQPGTAAVSVKKDSEFLFPEEGTYAAAVLEIDDFQKQAARFGENLKEMLEKPMLDLAAQIPRVSRRGKLGAVQPGHYILFYRVTDANTFHRDILSVIRQLQSVWHDFMNLSVSAAVMEAVEAQNLKVALEEAEDLMLFTPLGGRGSIVTKWDQGVLKNGMEDAASRYARLLTCLYQADIHGFEQERQQFFEVLDQQELEGAKRECLRLIALLAMKFREYEDDFFAVFPEEVNYYEKLERIAGIRELELWMSNYFRWHLEYLENRINSRQDDVIWRAKRFIGDNFSNPELTLGTVAAYVGFNEKYFTTRFTKEAGTTFRDYLTDIRLGRAKKLMDTTDLKMYEISDRVGYNNVEHFNRMFKKRFGISPGDYKKSK